MNAAALSYIERYMGGLFYVEKNYRYKKNIPAGIPDRICGGNFIYGAVW